MDHHARYLLKATYSIPKTGGLSLRRALNLYEIVNPVRAVQIIRGHSERVGGARKWRAGAGGGGVLVRGRGMWRRCAKKRAVGGWCGEVGCQDRLCGDVDVFVFVCSIW